MVSKVKSGGERKGGQFSKVWMREEGWSVKYEGERRGGQ